MKQISQMVIHPMPAKNSEKKLLMNIFFKAKFNYCPFVDASGDELNNEINSLH